MKKAAYSRDVPYLSYLMNLRENPNKYSAQKASPVQGIMGSNPQAAKAAVFQETNDDVMKRLIKETKIKESVRQAMMPPSEEGPSNRALTDDEGNVVTLEQIEAGSEGLMSPSSESDLGVTDPDKVFEEGNFKNDVILGEFTGTIDILQKNTEFTTKLSTIAEKYDITEREILRVAARESSLLTDPNAKNMFEILGTPAEEAGIDLDKLNSSTNPVDHLNALEKYLDRWDYDGKASLGLLIAAPAARNASSDYVVYKKGSAELKANPKWAGPDGNATVESINKFYRGE